MEEQKRILIVCFRFPPFPGIGGRRWAKFAKKLHQDGHIVEVIAAQNPFSRVSEWEKDIKGIKVHYLPLLYPSVLLNPPKTVFEKIKYRIALSFIKLITKGNPFDTAVFWKSQLHKKVKELVKEKKIENVIVSVAPFMLGYYSVQLKKDFPNLNVIVDFRDLWTADTANSSFSGLSSARKDFERTAEKVTLKKADTVITVAEKMVKDFKEISDHPNYIVIPNGYDEDELIVNKDHIKKPGDKLNLVFTGTLYPNLENIFFPFIDGLTDLQKTDKMIYDRLNIELVGNIPQQYISYVKEKRISIIKFIPHLSLNKVHEKISSSDACMLFLNDVYSFSLSTKFCEYIAQKKKIIVVSNKGETANYILQNKLGYWIDPAKATQTLKEVFSDFERGELSTWNSPYDVSSFSIHHLTKKLLSVLK